MHLRLLTFAVNQHSSTKLVQGITTIRLPEPNINSNIIVAHLRRLLYCQLVKVLPLWRDDSRDHSRACSGLLCARYCAAVQSITHIVFVLPDFGANFDA